jgi:hypothetical protein
VLTGSNKQTRIVICGQRGTVLGRFWLYHLRGSKRYFQSILQTNATITANHTIVFNPTVASRLARPFTDDDKSEHKPIGLFASPTQSSHTEVELLSTWHQSAAKSVMLSRLGSGPLAERYGKTGEQAQHWAMIAVLFAQEGRAQ